MMDSGEKIIMNYQKKFRDLEKVNHYLELDWLSK